MRELVATGLLAAIVCGPADAQESDTASADGGANRQRSEFLWLEAADGRIGGRAHFGGDVGDRPILIVVLHGDLLEPDNSYHYGFARTVANQASNVVAVGLLRPGYSDEGGNRSDGEILNATGDNYTPKVVDAVADATAQMSDRYHAGATVLIGHSGGAAIAALVLGRRPDVADAALLVACPCDVPAWRAYMMSLRPNPVWQQPHRGLSPLDFTAAVAPTALVELMVGDEDDVVRPEYSEDYAAALQARDVEAHVTILPGLGHNILPRPPVLGMATELIRRVSGSSSSTD